MTAITERKVAPKKDVAPNKDVESYLRENFPLQGKEFQVDFKTVGETNFRVNFWEKIDRDGTFSACRIGRSYYVVCKWDGTNWTHKVK